MSTKIILWKKVIVFLSVIVVTGLVLYNKRFTILVWHLQSNKNVQELVIHEMLKRAKPIILQDVKMNFLEKAYSWGAGKRNEKERQIDASDDVRIFVESSFKNNVLRFKDVHNIAVMSNFSLHGAPIALEWYNGNKEEVLVAFDINFLKKKVSSMQINTDCSFFKKLKSYVESKARKN